MITYRNLPQQIDVDGESVRNLDERGSSDWWRTGLPGYSIGRGPNATLW